MSAVELGAEVGVGADADAIGVPEGRGGEALADGGGESSSEASGDALAEGVWAG